MTREVTSTPLWRERAAEVESVGRLRSNGPTRLRSRLVRSSQAVVVLVFVGWLGLSAPNGSLCFFGVLSRLPCLWKTHAASHLRVLMDLLAPQVSPFALRFAQMPPLPLVLAAAFGAVHSSAAAPRFWLEEGRR